jgi:hypothetical protein
LAYEYVSRKAGDHPLVEQILAALEEDAGTIPEGSATPRAQVWIGEALSRFVDPFILSSFDRTGFCIHSLTFQAEDLKVDLSGRRCVVTGANSAIGYESALTLADLGAEVVLLCRNLERGEKASQKICEATGNSRVFTEPVDMSALGSIRAAAQRLSSGSVDVVVHNAGVLADERVETGEGLESAFATHVVGPHLLPFTRETEDDRRALWSLCETFTTETMP